MATIYAHGDGYRVQVGELSGKKIAARCFVDLLRAYAREKTPSHRGSRWGWSD